MDLDFCLVDLALAGSDLGAFGVWILIFVWWILLWRGGDLDFCLVDLALGGDRGAFGRRS